MRDKRPRRIPGPQVSTDRFFQARCSERDGVGHCGMRSTRKRWASQNGKHGIRLPHSALAPEHEPLTFPGCTPQHLLVKSRCDLLICSLLKPVVLVSIVRGVYPIDPDEGVRQ